MRYAGSSAFIAQFYKVGALHWVSYMTLHRCRLAHKWLMITWVKTTQTSMVVAIIWWANVPEIVWMLNIGDSQTRVWFLAGNHIFPRFSSMFKHLLSFILGLIYWFILISIKYFIYYTYVVSYMDLVILNTTIPSIFLHSEIYIPCKLCGISILLR